MSKRSLPVLLLLATAVLAGCGDDDEGDNTAKDTSSESSSPRAARLRPPA